LPTIARIGNVKIRVFADDHNPPHFHVVTPDRDAKVRLDDLTLFEGSLRRADFDTALAWAREHRKELHDEWDRLNRR
jgi:hypothetical protein